MIEGKFNIILDAFWGSSGKGKTSAWLADRYGVTHVSSSNYPNAGHTAAFADGTKFVAKAIPTAAILSKVNGMGMKCFVSPGSGFGWEQLVKEWAISGRPEMLIHSRSSVVTDDHKRREAEGPESTKHLASTMQGSGTAIADKVLRKADVPLAGTHELEHVVRHLYLTSPAVRDALGDSDGVVAGFLERVRVVSPWDFRVMTHSAIESGLTWLHEGSQGYALSIDHGSHYPNCTSRNCTVQAAMDHMAVPPSMVGDVYLNLRTFPIRVGNVVENGVQMGYSGDFYPDCQELTWEQVAAQSGMPPHEAAVLAERERTTVTKRVRRVSTFSFDALKDAVRVNGVTKLALNFVQYLDWADNGVKGEAEAFGRLSRKTREFVDRIEAVANLPVVLIGTGALHDEMIFRG